MLLNEDEMTRLWLLRKGYEPLRSDCRIERSDGADLQSAARLECRLWMERLLAEGNPALIILHDLVGEAELPLSITTAPSLLVRLPGECARPVAVKLKSWLSPATLVEAGSARARAQYTPYGAGGVSSPVAVIHPDNRLELFSPAYDDNDTLEYLMCAMRLTDADGRPMYEFRPAALDTL